MKTATLVLLVKDGSVILAKKKKKVGVGKWNGYGGKVEGSDSIRKTAKDEVKQESGVVIEESDLEEVGLVVFHINAEPAWKVHVFIARRWTNEPEESDEMGKPEPFKLDNIPYHEMLSADQKWMPLVLSGKKIKADAYYDAEMNLKDFSFTESTF